MVSLWNISTIWLLVEYFHRSTVAAKKLRSLQLQMFPNKTVLKLKNDVPTRWNSTYYNKQRFKLFSPFPDYTWLWRKNSAPACRQPYWSEQKSIYDGISLLACSVWNAYKNYIEFHASRTHKILSRFRFWLL